MLDSRWLEQTSLIVTVRPVFSEDRVCNESELTQQEAFREATQYAVGAKDNPIYVNLAKGADAIAYNLAVADWFGQPKVLEIEPRRLDRPGRADHPHPGEGRLVSRS